jgi:hypothetical protein
MIPRFVAMWKTSSSAGQKIYEGEVVMTERGVVPRERGQVRIAGERKSEGREARGGEREGR